MAIHPEYSPASDPVFSGYCPDQLWPCNVYSLSIKLYTCCKSIYFIKVFCCAFVPCYCRTFKQTHLQYLPSFLLTQTYLKKRYWHCQWVNCSNVLCHFNLDVSNHVMMLGAGKLNTHCSSTTVFVVRVTKERATGAPVPYWISFDEPCLISHLTAVEVWPLRVLSRNRIHAKNLKKCVSYPGFLKQSHLSPHALY